MGRQGLRATTFQPEVWERLDRVRAARGLRSVAETISILSMEAELKIGNQEDIKILSPAEQYAKASLLGNKAGILRPGKNGPSQTRTGDLLGVNEITELFAFIECPPNPYAFVIPGSYIHKAIREDLLA